jgi:2-(1,2-epoxy-1,2-dihydrophenyl)acetyl-CoA isomerase
MANEMTRALRAAAEDPDVRAIVLGSDGGHFCSGLDLAAAFAEMQGVQPKGGRSVVEKILFEALHPMVNAVWASDKPTLASLDGATVGFGMSLALACDLRLMADGAFLQTGFIGRGLFPDGGIAYQLERLCGLSHAKQLLLFPDLKLSAVQALEFGLAVGVVPASELDQSTAALAQKLAALAPLPVRALKRHLRAPSANLEAALEAENDPVARCVGSEDAAEGFAAFFEKRAPSFKGR